MSQGFVADGFQPLADAFDSLFEDGLDDGASLAVYQHGKAALDLWGGVDPHDGTPWGKDSATIGFSTTKGAATIMLLRLVERGLIDLDAPVSHYWPEFAANGKGQITVRQVTQHRSALPFLAGPVEEFFTPGLAEATIGGQAPAYPVNSYFNYHAVTFGTLMGEIIYRVSGQRVGDFFAAEIAGPLGLEFWIGEPESVEPQFRRSTYSADIQLPPEVPAEMLAQLPPAVSAGVETTQQLMSLFTPDSRQAGPNTLAYRRAQMAGANGVNNARALARMYAAVIGEVDGIRLLSEETVEQARRYATADIQRPPLPDGTAQDQPRWGVGFQLEHQGEPMLAEGSFGHAGMGGRLGYAHPESGIAYGYVGQRMFFDPSGASDERHLRLQRALRGIVFNK
ncbi:CubicO group peptidase (beta-lactamase class C family) [Psychromicrobium silvestre]|uniref:CubicO group peptidase (Beta-lactamase class C family) n=1 Tax=Psychromicrobium silvestre TaxID=1645614 RepID=A0A7Y9LTQ6_9MICC|nr:CubicO group peptidase (beta-lactamase class C family) [Psychromicrobium silvestre]